MKYAFVATFVYFIVQVKAHSWAACTDYKVEDPNYKVLGDFNIAKCKGYPRDFKFQIVMERKDGWGADSGFEHRHPDTCKVKFDPKYYDNETPMARYTSGQVIHISHPAKNHVADTCTNEFIPSERMELRISSQPNQDLFDIKAEMIGPDHKKGSIDHLGYQNCYKFCDNQDRSHCVTSWIIPQLKTPGKYSGMWFWEFNPKEFYNTCFDFEIVNLSSPSVAPSTSAVPTTSTTPSTTATSSTSKVPLTTVPQLPSTTVPLVTSDANQISSAIADFFKYIRVTFNGTFNITRLQT